MNKRVSDNRITASRVRVGTVLYHGGEVTSVERLEDGRIRITNGKAYGGWTHVYPANKRLTYYPRLSG